MTEPAATNEPQTTSPAAVRHRARRKPAASASRLALAGGALGLSFGLVGAMTAAAQASQDAAQPAALTVQRVIMTEAATAPAQFIVMLPEAVTAPATTIAIPTRPKPAAPSSEQAPAVEAVSESSGS